MEAFLKWLGAVIAALFLIAVVAAMYAGVAWIVKALWTS